MPDMGGSGTREAGGITPRICDNNTLVQGRGRNLTAIRQSMSINVNVKVPDSWCHDAVYLGLKVDSWSMADRVVVDWRISECKLVDDNEASHVNKPVVLF